MIRIVGQALVEEGTDSGLEVSGGLPGKIHRIQAELPEWLRKHPLAQPEVEGLMRQLDQEIRSGDLKKAAGTVEEILGLMGS